MRTHSSPAFRTTITLLLLGALGALPACADTPRPSASTDAALTTPSLAMKSAAPRKANGSGIDVQFRIDGAARLGEPLPISLSFEGITDPSGARVRFTVDAGLTLPPAYTGEFALTGGASSAPTLTVPVIPAADGLAYLNVFTTQHGVTSVSSVAVQVGKAAALKLRGDIKTTPSGDRILTVPVP